MPQLDETHDPKRRSWVESANDGASDFPIQNLPFGVFAPPGGEARPGVAIGDRILDLSACLDASLFAGEAERAARAAAGPTLNGLLALGRAPARALRRRIGQLLDADGEDRRTVQPLERRLLHRAEICELRLPTAIRDYTDFYAGIHHARAAGALMLPDDPLPANYKWVPIAYHGRASSVRVSGEEVRRPAGQARPRPDADPQFGPSQRLDIELELGFYVARGNGLGEPVPIGQADEQIFGFCLLNDWSARDIQRWEMVPLGPFNGKNFSTTVSPWIVTADALAPFRKAAMAREPGDPRPLPYLWDEPDQAAGGVDIALEVRFSSGLMRARGVADEVIIRSNAGFLYWTPAQMIAHHTAGGCNLAPGDLIGTGTISGPTRDQLSSLLELTGGGAEPFRVATGETRTFLEDGDEIVFRGVCQRDGFARIGFGECRGRIVPSSAGGIGR